MTRKGKLQQCPSDVAQIWLLSKQRASIEGIDLLPEENIYLRGNPLVVARGQAQAFYLRDAMKRVWILKKFLPGRNPDAHYIKAIHSLIPKHKGFESGYERKVLSRASVAASTVPTAYFPIWLEDTILMPRVEGSDWAYIADKVREGKISLTPEQRLLLCRNLSEKVSVLEKNNLSHRDLSSTNIFIDTNTWNIHLIDWDSIYHPSLTIPPNTTFGTNGYIAPFVRVNATEDARTTWTTGADRFSLGVLNVEFLSVERNSSVTGDGGLLNQDEIYNLGGSGINKITGDLQRNFPSAFDLFNRILQADNFDECPGPDEWKALGAGVTAPSLKDVYDPQPDFLTFIQGLQRAQKARIPAPPLPPKPDVQYVPATRDDGPPAPSLATLEPLDWGNLIPRALPQTAQAAPRLAEIQDEGESVTPQKTSGLPAPAAISLADIEDPFTGAN